MYVVGEAEGFSFDENGRPMLTPVVGGADYHNAPGAPQPHAVSREEIRREVCQTVDAERRRT